MAKNKISIAITIRNDIEERQLFSGNGLSQNVKFLYDQMKLIDTKPFFLVDTPVENSIFNIDGERYKAHTLQEILDGAIKVDLALEAGVSIAQESREKLREVGARIVSVRYGHSMFMDMEQICYKETMSAGLYINKPDIVWASPHFENSYSYLETIYQAPVVTCPYIWEPDFVAQGTGDDDYQEVPDIYVMEPNISVLKNALLPITIIESLYRQKPDSFGKAMILNGTGFNTQKYFLENIVRNFSSALSESEKMYFTGRYKFDEAFKKRDILLGHQWGCELNYLYLEALYKNIPLVHNSPMMSEVGYYYPEFDVNIGCEQLIKAIRDKNIGAQLKRNSAFLKEYSIHNTDNKICYRALVADALN